MTQLQFPLFWFRTQFGCKVQYIRRYHRSHHNCPPRSVVQRKKDAEEFLDLVLYSLHEDPHTIFLVRQYIVYDLFTGSCYGKRRHTNVNLLKPEVKGTKCKKTLHFYWWRVQFFKIYPSKYLCSSIPLS